MPEEPRSVRSARFHGGRPARPGRDSGRRRTVLFAGCGLVALISGCTSGAASNHTTSTPTGSTTTGSTTTSAPAATSAAVAPVASPPAVAIPAPSAGGWRLNGSTRLSGGALVLTKAGARMTAGSAIWPHQLTAAKALHASFNVTTSGGTGADGITLAIIDARTGKPTSLGHVGGGLGWAGIPGLAVALDTFRNPGDPSYNDVGVVQGFRRLHTNQLTWAKANAAIPPLRNSTRRVTVGVQKGVLTVAVDGATALTTTVVIPGKFLIGFTAANGARTDRHVVSDVVITTG